MANLCHYLGACFNPGSLRTFLCRLGRRRETSTNSGIRKVVGKICTRKIFFTSKRAKDLANKKIFKETKCFESRTITARIFFFSTFPKCSRSFCFWVKRSRDFSYCSFSCFLSHGHFGSDPPSPSLRLQARNKLQQKRAGGSLSRISPDTQSDQMNACLGGTIFTPQIALFASEEYVK